jgi:hypothetical protein
MAEDKRPVSLRTAADIIAAYVHEYLDRVLWELEYGQHNPLWGDEEGDLTQCPWCGAPMENKEWLGELDPSVQRRANHILGTVGSSWTPRERQQFKMKPTPTCKCADRIRAILKRGHALEMFSAVREKDPEFIDRILAIHGVRLRNGESTPERRRDDIPF